MAEGDFQSFPRDVTKGGLVPCTGLFLLPMYLSLEVSVGKATTIYAINGSAILLPCTFSSCYGFENLYFRWSYNNSETSRIVSAALTSFPLSVPCPKMPSSTGFGFF